MGVPTLHRVREGDGRERLQTAEGEMKEKREGKVPALYFVFSLEAVCVCVSGGGGVEGGDSKK